ncbi:hypothetical protein EDC96DRAFT_565007 [Choanephora cucurbitarum]|nr:hypothetical protein EDC96DRAFT_565007 [Choanephora cucurbitarum]
MSGNSNFAYEIRFVEDNVVQIYDIAAKRKQQDSENLLPTEYKEEDVVEGKLRYSKLVGSTRSNGPKDIFGLEDNGQPYQHHVVTKISKNRKSTQRNTFFMMGGAGGDSSCYDFDDTQVGASVAESISYYGHLDKEKQNINPASPIKTQFETNSLNSIAQPSMHSPIHSPVHSPIHSPIHSPTHSALYSSMQESLSSFANSNIQSAFCLKTNSSLYPSGSLPDIDQLETDASSMHHIYTQSNTHSDSQIDNTTYTRSHILSISSNRMIMPITESDLSPTETIQTEQETTIQPPPKIVTRTSIRRKEEEYLSKKASLPVPSYEAEDYTELSINESISNDSKRHIQQSSEKKSPSVKRSCCIIS